jgi:hypothetical protein
MWDPTGTPTSILAPGLPSGTMTVALRYISPISRLALRYDDRSTQVHQPISRLALGDIPRSMLALWYFTPVPGMLSVTSTSSPGLPLDTSSPAPDLTSGTVHQLQVQACSQEHQPQVRLALRSKLALRYSASTLGQTCPSSPEEYRVENKYVLLSLTLLKVCL